jgi:hypothetical protein
MFNDQYYLADIGQSAQNRENIPARSYGTMINYQLQILSNAQVGQTTWTFEVNGVPKITKLVAGLQVGIFTDITAVPFNKNDLLVFRFTKVSPGATIQIKQSAKFQFF